MYHLPHQLIKTFICFIPAILLLGGCAAPQKTFVPPVFPSGSDAPRFIYERTLMSSGDVEEMTSADRFKMFATGESKKIRGLAKPFDIAVHKGRVYVSDTVQRGVAMFDIPGQQFKVFGNTGAGILRKPIGIDVSIDGEVFVIDTTAKRIFVYDRDGNFLRRLGAEAELVRPTGLAVSSNKVFVVDTGGIRSEKHQVKVLDSKTGELLQTIGKRGSAEGDFNLPLMMDVDSQGHSYVVDSGNFRVQHFDEEGKFVSSFGTVGTLPGQFARPKGIAVDNEGNIYVGDTSFGNIQIFNNEGALLMFMGQRGSHNEPAKYSLLGSLDVDEDGRIYIIDQFFTKVDIFRPYSLKAEEGYATVKPKK